MKRFLIGFLFLFSLLFSLIVISSCSHKITKKTEVKVCSGAGLIKPMNELINLFKKKYDMKVEVHYGGSAEIFSILQTTCGCDVFIPGAYKYLEDVEKRGYILKDTVKKLVLHIPVIAVPKGNPGKIKSLEDLAKKGIKVALGDPKACAIGKVAVKILKKAHLWNKVKKNVITFTPTVNQLLIYIATSQVDAAIIWEDLTTWAQAKGKIETIQIKPNIIKTIPTAVTTCAKNRKALKAALLFNNFISSNSALKVWEKWGFKPCK